MDHGVTHMHVHAHCTVMHDTPHVVLPSGVSLHLSQCNLSISLYLLISFRDTTVVLLYDPEIDLPCSRA